MDSSWKWKAGFIVAVALLCAYGLVPSVVYFRMPPEARNDQKAFEEKNPKWAPSKHLNLGLDLQGGVHLVMGVEVDKAVREKAVRRAEEISAELQELLVQREKARAAKDWKAADASRDKILAQGYLIEDTPAGARLKKK